MKTLTTVLFATLLGCTFYACKKTGSATLTNTLTDTLSLSGKWTLAQYYSNPGGGGAWLQANDRMNGYMQFDTNGKLQSTVPDIMGNGTSAVYTTYAITDSVTVKFTRTDNSFENFTYSIKSGTLQLIPKGPILCFEGCGFRLTKAGN